VGSPGTALFVLGCLSGFLLAGLVMSAVLMFILPSPSSAEIAPSSFHNTAPVIKSDTTSSSLAISSAAARLRTLIGFAPNHPTAEAKGPEVPNYPSKEQREADRRAAEKGTTQGGSPHTVVNTGGAGGDCFERDVDYYGNDVEGGHDAKTPEDCQAQCVTADKCNYFTFEVKRNMCWLKNTKIGRRPGQDLVSGPRNCSETMEIRELFEPYKSVQAASDAVLGAFKHAYGSYAKHCFGKDELRPMSKGCINEFGLGLTIVDALDTMYIMGLHDEFKRARDWVANMRVDVPKHVSVFETIIRVLGGLLSAHGLSKDPVFLDKSLALAKQLSPALTGNIPKSRVNLRTGQTGSHGWAPNTAVIAEVGSLQIEMWYLTKASKEQRWNNYGDQVIRFLDTRHPQFPGLYPTFINFNGGFSQNHISFGALGDSLYEYLLKMWILNGKQANDKYRRMYLQSIDTMMNKLLTKSNEGLWYIAEMRGGNLDHKMDHLTCFAPGMLALGYHHKVSTDMEVNKKHLKAAEDVLETCVQMYIRWPISPEMVRFTPYMTIGSATNFQRPETVESLFVLWQVTKNEKWRKYGWTIFQKFERHLKVPNGYASLNHVADTNSKSDKMESFLLAETHKYLYLLFQDNPSITIDTYVFNTEAHPMPIAAS